MVPSCFCCQGSCKIPRNSKKLRQSSLQKDWSENSLLYLACCLYYFLGHIPTFSPKWLNSFHWKRFYCAFCEKIWVDWEKCISKLDQVSGQVSHNEKPLFARKYFFFKKNFLLLRPFLNWDKVSYRKDGKFFLYRCFAKKFLIFSWSETEFLYLRIFYFYSSGKFSFHWLLLSLLYSSWQKSYIINLSLIHYQWLVHREREFNTAKRSKLIEKYFLILKLCESIWIFEYFSKNKKSKTHW